jgi:hypothetical protein
MSRDKPIKPPSKAFSLAHNPKPTIADKDNVQRQPKPPMHIEHPRLAPPGMAGVRSSRPPTLPHPSNTHSQNPKPALAQRPALNREIGKPSEVNKEFKAIAEKTQGIDRAI